MKTISTAWYIRTVFAVMALVLTLTWGANSAHADEHVGSSVSIAPSGQTMVKGARVTSISGSTIVAETGWGAAKVSWTVQASGSTRFTPDLGSNATLARIKVGHTIAFTGMLNGTIAKPTVNASSIKDSELIKDAVSILGTVESVDVDAGTYVVRTQNGETTVQVYRGTLMSRDGGYMHIGDIKVGDSSRATGTLDTGTGVLAAERVTLRAAPVAPVVAEVPEQSVFSTVYSWLTSTRGILSVRDR